MQTINDYDKDIFNGDLGFVHAVDAEAQELVVDFDGRLINYDFGELDELIPAYAITIHKSQGSEYPAVVIPLSTQHYPMLRRNLVYTGITRQTAGGPGGATQSVEHGGQGFARRAPVVKTQSMATGRGHARGVTNGSLLLPRAHCLCALCLVKASTLTYR